MLIDIVGLFSVRVGMTNGILGEEAREFWRNSGVLVWSG